MFRKQKGEINNNKKRGVLWGLLFLAAIMTWISFKQIYRAYYWVPTYATVNEIQIKSTNIRSRYSSRHKTILNIKYDFKGTNFHGKLITRSKNTKYKPTQSLKILINPNDPAQVDFYHQNEGYLGHFFAGLLVIIFCSFFLIKGKLRHRSLA